MITRPLDVSTRLRPAPRNFDYLFWVNGALIALFFAFFGSRFVLSPGMGVGKAEDMLPVIPNAVAGGIPTQLQLEVAEGGKLCIDTGFISFESLRGWLAEQAKRTPGATLLLKYNLSNSVELMTRIIGAANEVGIKVQLAALDRASTTDVRELGSH